MVHTTHPRGLMAARLLLIIVSGLVLVSCARVYRSSDYNVHMIGTALIDNSIHDARLHFNRVGDSFRGFYTIELPEYTLERAFECGVFYYPLQRTFFGQGGGTRSLNFQDEVPGEISALTSVDSLHVIRMYDRLGSTPEQPFIGIIIDTRLDSVYRNAMRVTEIR